MKKIAILSIVSLINTFYLKKRNTVLVKNRKRGNYMSKGESTIQKNVNKIVQETLLEMRRSTYTVEDFELQGYTRSQLSKYLQVVMPDLPKEEKSKMVDKMYNMILGDLKYEFSEIDEKRKKELEKQNEYVIFSQCLIAELSKMVQTDKEKAQTIKIERIKAYRDGKMPYDEKTITITKIILEHNDDNLPYNLRRLKKVELMPSSIDIIEAIKNNKTVKL